MYVCIYVRFGMAISSYSFLCQKYLKLVKVVSLFKIYIFFIIFVSV